MKRCPKCNRTYPDDNQKFCTFDGGLLVTADQDFDPNATVHSARVSPVDPSGQTEKATSRELPDLNATVASAESKPTKVFSKHTGPTGLPTVVDQPAAAPPYTQTVPQPPATEAPKKKSKVPLLIGILLLLLVLGVSAVVGLFFFVIKPRLNEMEAERRPAATTTTSNENENVTDNTAVSDDQTKTEDEYVAPPDTVKFTNSQTNLDGRLAEHYFDFSFYYPKNWETDPNAGVPGASNFAKVERRLPPDFTQENFAVGWYTSNGTYEEDQNTFPQLVEVLSSSLSNGFPGYRKVSEGPTRVNSLDGYEFRFVSVSKGTEKGDIDLWGRVVFLPSGVSGSKTGATLIMLATSLTPELSGVEDVGAKGEMQVILESFRFGKR